MGNDSNRNNKGGVGSNRQVRKEIKQFESRVAELKERGYTPLMPSRVTDIGSEVASSESLASKKKSIGGASIQYTFDMFEEKEANPTEVVGIGTAGLGYVPWGPDNILPNTIYKLVSSLPYTAAAIKYIVDLTVGSGPALTYRWVRYVNGTVKEEHIPYENAGVLIANRIREVRDEMRDNGEEEDDSSSKTVTWASAISNGSGSDPQPGTRAFELKQLKEDYAIWSSTNQEYQKFIEDNNLGLHYLKCMTDDGHMDIYYPTIGLSKGRKDEHWNPKVVRIGHRPAVSVRMEEMDKDMRINYVYYSEKWRTKASDKPAEDEIVAYPALMPETMLSDLRNIVDKNKTTSVKRRPLWFCCPTYYPSMSRPYYPQPAWWSIFPSKAYDYASTLITDKAIMRKNSTMWGKMIFINNEYLRSICSDAGADTSEEMDKIRLQIYGSVNDLLRSKENNGKTICLDMWPDAQGKMQHAVEIVDVPQATSGKDMKDELEEISSIIFFAIGVHPALIGAVPGKSGSSGGTYQRELHLLKQNQVSPRQRIYLKWLQNIHSFNRWDKHGVWVIRQPVLTTLDRNSSGTEETESK